MTGTPPRAHGVLAWTGKKWHDRAVEWAALGKAVVNRRVELGYTTRHGLATAAPMSERLLSDIEKARRTSYDPATLSRLERALRWPVGTVQSVLDGEAAPATTEDFQSFLISRTRDRAARLLDPDGPLDAKTRMTLSALISCALDLVETPSPAVERLRDAEAREEFDRTVAAIAEHQRLNPLPERPEGPAPMEPAMRQKPRP